MTFTMWWQTRYQRNIRLVATPIESLTKMLSPIIAVDKYNTSAISRQIKGLLARRTSKPYINIQQLL